MYEVHTARRESIFLLLMMMFAIAKSSTYTYTISPRDSSTTSNCSTAQAAHSVTCLNLSEAVSAAAGNISGITSNVSLILLPGNHSLFSEHTLSGLVHLSIKSDERDLLTVINCVPTSKLHFTDITKVHIQGITFKNCLETTVNTVTEFIIEDSTLLGGVTDGRALTVTQSMVIVLRSQFISFKKSDSPGNEHYGGAISCSESNLLIMESIFLENRAQYGGALYGKKGSIIVIISSTFSNNSANRGGVLHILQKERSKKTDSMVSVANLLNVVKYHAKYLPATTKLYSRGSILCIGSNFTKNRAKRYGGAIYYSDCNRDQCTIYLHQNRFLFNNANGDGGVLRFSSNSLVTIKGCSFQNSEASQFGGVVFSSNSRIVIRESVFQNNTAHKHAGVIYATSKTHLIVDSCEFHNNTARLIGGSMYVHDNSELLLEGLTTFTTSSAVYGAVINVYESAMTCNGTLYITNNNGSISTAHSRVYLSGNMTFSDNNGSLYFLDTEVVIINGSFYFTNHTHFTKLESGYTLEGGCMTLFISRMSINGTIRLVDNSATNGGGLLSIASRISIGKNGQLDVMNNLATDSGGGLYLFNSELYIQGTVRLQGNRANTFGGGIHSISSTIVIILNQHNSHIKFDTNIASSGGGICMEASSKFYIKHRSGSTSANATKFIGNAAKFGGAIYVADNTTRSICAGSKLQSVTAASQSECFIQVLRSITAFGNYPHIGQYFFFSRNTASSGSKLYGGLLDRCTVNAFGKNIMYSSIHNSFESIENSTTSDPVRVCLCDSNNMLNCDHHSGFKEVMKGKRFTLNVAAVDHVEHKVQATIHSLLASQRGHLGDRQRSQRIEAMCTHLNFSIITPVKDTDVLVLYAKGPCSDQGMSSLKINISFIPCQCPVGFETVQSIINRCVCGCHHVLRRIFPFITESDCNPELLTITRKKDFWISVVNQNNKTTFLSYKQCPSDYCYRSTSPVQIDFSSEAGPDVQCSFNRTGVLCGRCEQTLSLSLGSSRCIECPRLWPAIFAAIIIASLLAGLGLVSIILAFNLTVAAGTLNATVFYANVLAANRQLFLPFENPNFHSILIAWLNLDIGFDVCFFEGLKADGKIWLQLTFSVYIILIVVAVIITSQYSKKFSNLIARKNPVATLATLILLSYAKLLHGIIGILSFAILHYDPLDGQPTFTKVVWLRDGSVEYLKGVHVPLFIVALLILLSGSFYTMLIFSWQWLVRFSNKPVFCCLRSTRLSSFMDAYHAPYTSRNRYWTGLLLLARVILYLTAAVNISDEPSVNLLAVSIVVGCILSFHAYSGVTVYKSWTLNCIEFATYFNILLFAVVKFYIQLVGGNHEAVAYVSISVQVVIFVCSLLRHIVSEFQILEKIKHAIIQWHSYRNHFRVDLHARLIDDNHTENKVTFSEVTIKKMEDQLQLEASSKRKEITTLF